MRQCSSSAADCTGTALGIVQCSHSAVTVQSCSLFPSSIEIKWRHIRKSPSRTIPTEIDPDADLNPDIVIFKGLNEDQQFPTKPTRDFTIQIADVLTGREGEQGSTEESMEAAAQSKIRKYSAYLQRLSRMGWKVDKTVHIIALGIRGGIPNITTKSTIKLGLKKPVAESVNYAFLVLPEVSGLETPDFAMN